MSRYKNESLVGKPRRDREHELEHRYESELLGLDYQNNRSKIPPVHHISVIRILQNASEAEVGLATARKEALLESGICVVTNYPGRFDDIFRHMKLVCSRGTKPRKTRYSVLQQVNHDD